MTQIKMALLVQIMLCIMLYSLYVSEEVFH